MSIIQIYEKVTGVAVYCVVLTVKKADSEGDTLVKFSRVNQYA